MFKDEFGRKPAVAAVIAVVALAGCSNATHWRGESVAGETADYETGTIPAEASTRFFPVETGVAAWDGDLGTRGMTGAHATLPIGSLARVTNARTGQSTMVRIDRRLSNPQGWAIELSRDAAAAVGALQNGMATVAIESVEQLRGGGVGPVVGRATPVQPPRVAPRQTVGPAEEIWRTEDIETASIDPVRDPYAPYVAPPAPTRASSIEAYDPLATIAPSRSYAPYNPDIATGAIPRSSDAFAEPRQNAPAINPTRLSANFLQVGSFRDVANAHRLVSRLNAEGMSNAGYGAAFVEQARVNGQIYHRVRVGPINDETNARRALRDAKALGHISAQLVRR